MAGLPGHLAAWPAGHPGHTLHLCGLSKEQVPGRKKILDCNWPAGFIDATVKYCISNDCLAELSATTENVNFD